MADTTVPTWPDGKPLKGPSLVSYLKFTARLEEFGATLLEPHWLGALKSHRIRCAKGHNGKPRPNALISGQGPCKECSWGVGGRPSAEERFRSIVAERGGVVLGAYVNRDTPVSIRCAYGHENPRKPTNVLHESGICRTCSGNDSAASEDKFRKAVESQGGTVTGAYSGTMIPVDVTCANGHPCTPTPSNVIQGQGVCGPCCGHLSDVFYVVSGSMGIKFGVTSGNPRPRLGAHRRDGYDTVARLFEGLKGTTARDLERELIALLKAAGIPPVRGREYYPIEALSTVLYLVDDWLA